MTHRALIAAAALAAGLMSAPAFAFPVVLSTTEEVIVNFDFTGSSPAPPYGAMTIEADLDPGLFNFLPLVLSLYGDLDGGGGLVTSTTITGSPLFTVTFPSGNTAAL